MADIVVFYTGPVVTRDAAKAAGDKRYFSGKPCELGHIEQRRVANGGCLACHREDMRRHSKTEKRQAYMAQYKAENVEHLRVRRRANKEAKRDEIQAKNAAYREANKERIAAYNKAAYEADPQKFLERCAKTRAQNPSYHAEWERANKPAVAAHRQKRRARKRAAGGSFTKEQAKTLLEAQGWKCIYCRASIKHAFHLDHKVPLSRGGSNDISNIQGLCPRCNTRKRTRDHIEFARLLGMLL